MELREQLQTRLGGAYQIDRELGGGGMSRVFAATETAFGRKVVVKVLPAELGAGVNVERFKREIQVAANLQHPHIVPVLTAGEMDGVPFYTMPFIDGHSLRARLASGPMPITECVNVLRDVARALAYAHEHGVVHRDIKPDNVLITGSSATVTDFGIAKAITAARANDTLGGGGSLTQFGMSIGTPTYMAPEQAAADPTTDHRADIYSFGCMAYEMLTGRPPFSDLSAQKLLAAHMGGKPRPVSELRPETPEALADVVMQCLEKDPDARPQSAADIAHVLDAVSTGSTVSMSRASRPGAFRRMSIAYVIAFAAAVIVAKAAEVAFGVPDWVVPSTIGIMAFGIPLILATAWVQRAARRAAASTPRTSTGPAPTTMATIAVRASPYLSWRHAGGFMASAISSFALLVVILMALRPLGLGPLKSLMASGQLHDRDRILVGDFASTGADTTLGGVVAEAVRADLGQSPVISLVTAQSVAADLQLMQKPANARIDTAVARAVARREGAKAIVTGEVHSLAGGGFVVTMRLVAADSGLVLASLSGSANGAKDLIPTIGGLTRSLRRQMGESLKHVQASAGLAQVTTASIEALEKYTEAQRAMTQGDNDKAIPLFKEAVKIDTGFASAYRGLAVALSNRGLDREGQIAAMERAYADTARLPEVERWLAVATYWTQGPRPNEAKAAAAYKSLLAIRPAQSAALNNLSLLYANQRKFDSAAALLRRAVASNPAMVTAYSNLIANEAEIGSWPAVDSTTATLLRVSGNNPRTALARTTQMFARGQYDSTLSLVDSVAAANPTDDFIKSQRDAVAGIVATTRGRIAEGMRLTALNTAYSVAHNNTQVTLGAPIDSAVTAVWFFGDTAKGLSIIQNALKRVPLTSFQPLDRPYSSLARAYALIGKPELAKSMLTEFDRISSAYTEEAAARTRHSIESSIAVAEHRYLDAAHESEAADIGNCTICELPAIGLAFDLAQKPDSAIAAFTKYVNSTSIIQRFGQDRFFLAGSYKRLGELWEAKGDRAKASHYYAKFLELWKNADPALQPQVTDVRRRLARLSDVEGR
jgi:eukaryotic-like serine/threonine-protein kinase